MSDATGFTIPKIELGDWIETGLDYLTTNYSGITRGISKFTETGIDVLNDALMWLPEWALIALVTLLCWRLAGTRLAIGSVLGLGLIWNLDLWDPMIESLTLVVIATLVAVVIAVPLGILAALSDRFYKVIMPVLDFMQTMPAFVYLIPAIPFFGIGSVSAIFATVIFSMPPAIRFTTLGIRQVPNDLIEAADAFGATRSQKLFKLQLPLSLPTVMAGINQTIMLALSMVVIAAMIGADGLGNEVWKAIQRLRPGDGFEAGIAVVILAMLLDRLTQTFSKEKKPRS
ncbi:proline/glycine betaine ABC transporter permease [Cobetia sp. cqz5-12]|uniref:ABC transporter permease n=1 Tax=unclassified Cobetia TaxID=2609414 RepID=UPI0014074958|nr:MULTISPECIES: proline/glycine betaine ABC transporter permease [unclassified Cobetia]NHH84962.1 Glycine betaine transport system permease protein OpuAB [Cobetia sp. MB87]QQK64165.1 proline/glycine betaine ABC transporter permease [Cobetia sp. cqz5-12]